MLASSMIDAEIVEHLESFSTISLRGLYKVSCTEFLGSAGFSQGVRQSERSEISRGADDGIKPGVKRSEPQDRQHKELAEPAKRPTVVRLQNVNNDDSTVGCSAGFGFFLRSVPGVPLRSTPGFMLSAAPRAAADRPGLSLKSQIATSKLLGLSLRLQIVTSKILPLSLLAGT
jgi:hypothetical protein